MIVSHKLKKVLLMNPKTGSKSLYDYFSPLHRKLDIYKHSHEIFFKDDHLCADYDYYAFYRDPVERALSSINHLKRTSKNLILNYNRNSMMYEDLLYKNENVPVRSAQRFMDNVFSRFINSLYENATGNEVSKKDNIFPLGNRSLEQVIFFKNLSIIDILEGIQQYPEYSILMSTNMAVFEHQSHWLDKPNMHILDFSNYDNEVRRVYAEFGGEFDEERPVKKINESVTKETDYTEYVRLMQKSKGTFTQEELDYIEYYYKEDYELYENYKKSAPIE